MTIYICPIMWYIISNNTFTIKIESMVKKGEISYYGKNQSQ